MYAMEMEVCVSATKVTTANVTMMTFRVRKLVNGLSIMGPGSVEKSGKRDALADFECDTMWLI
jgi:hypothetical protein